METTYILVLPGDPLVGVLAYRAGDLPSYREMFGYGRPTKLSVVRVALTCTTLVSQGPCKVLPA